MKTTLKTTKLISGTLAVAGLLVFGTQAKADFSDDFSGLTDSLWTHDTAYVFSFGQTFVQAGGNYTLSAPVGGLGYGYAGSLAPGVMGTEPSALGEVSVRSDIVNFQGNGPYGVWGVAMDVNNLATPLGLTGYTLIYEPYGGPGSGFTGSLEIIRIDTGADFVGIGGGSVDISLSTSTDYTMLLTHANNGDIVGELWEVGGLAPLVRITEPGDTTYMDGRSGLVVFITDPGEVSPVVTTFDNFNTEVPEPGSAALLGLGVLGFLARRFWPKK